LLFFSKYTVCGCVSRRIFATGRLIEAGDYFTQKAEPDVRLIKLLLRVRRFNATLVSSGRVREGLGSALPGTRRALSFFVIPGRTWKGHGGPARRHAIE
jgi:hypothetical protein